MVSNVRCWKWKEGFHCMHYGFYEMRKSNRKFFQFTNITRNTQLISGRPFTIYIYTYDMSIYECIKFCFWKETHLRSRCMYLTLQNVSWLLKRQNVVIIFVWMPYIGVRTYFHSNYIQQFQIQHKIFCSLFHLPSCLFQLSEMVYLMHREIMESRIPSNYFYIPFVYICFIYVDQRTRISVQGYCNNRMYILVKEYRIIFWVMQVLFTHVR